MDKLSPLAAVIAGIISIIAAILPILFSYFFKRIERRSALFINKSKIEEASRRMDFVDKYLDLQAKMLDAAELTALKKNASADLLALKQSIDLNFIKTETAHKEKVSNVQKLFLTFRPTTWLGWVLAVIFYFWLIIMVFLIIAFFIDDSSNFTVQGLTQNLHNGNLIAGAIFICLIGLLIRFLALALYKKHPPIQPTHAPMPVQP